MKDRTPSILTIFCMVASTLGHSCHKSLLRLQIFKCAKMVLDSVFDLGHVFLGDAILTLISVRILVKNRCLTLEGVFENKNKMLP